MPPTPVGKLCFYVKCLVRLFKGESVGVTVPIKVVNVEKE